MATGATAPPLAVPSSPPPLPAQSPSNLSSPLSEVEDKDDDADELDIDMRTIGSGAVDLLKHDIGNRGDELASSSDLDDESKLSDADVNDSEAETERLYDTPPKNKGTRDFVPNPSKLQQQVRAEVLVHKVASDNESLSDADHGDSDDVLSPPNKEIPAASIEEVFPEPRRAKSRRNGAKDRKTKSPDDGDGGGDGERRGANNSASLDRPTRGADDEPEAEADEDAEAIHREELERKKQAWQELTAIEKQFGSFRERLYEERLAQLNQEEAMLSGPNPTHPEYLAMLQSVR
ncbi:hypothetical protein P8C59_007855 [Phyllachora maydis]|uniref:Uncharacterized protein n=1 Tax=Phyllachora maydis TaxID=1825666 RepID=A0AAD9IAI8_9PEZI|nr:hypothetical protein P8C59_007855 [Phyllachora maydis]